MSRNYIKEICLETRNIKTNKTIQSKYFKKKIKIFRKKNTISINPNLKRIFKYMTVKEWYILSTKIEQILKNDDFKLQNSKIVTTLILSFLSPSYEYLLSPYYYSSSKRIPKIKSKFIDIKFLIKSLMLNNDQDPDHLTLVKYKLNHMNISNYKFVFKDKLSIIQNKKQLYKETLLTKSEKDILKHYLTSNRRRRNFKIYKIAKDQIFDAFLLFFLDLRKYELLDILFYKKNLNYFDYDFEVFVIKQKQK